jgi:ParB family chromosome partitioning protein
MRLQAVEWLAAEYEASADAQKSLRGAVESRYRKVREKAAFELAGKKDATAFPSLAKFLAEANAHDAQTRIMQAMLGLGDKRCADAFIDRIENDPGGTAYIPNLLAAIEECRDPKSVDRLFPLFPRLKDWERALKSAILGIAGCKQYIHDPHDQNPQDRAKWMKDQHPRHDGILARMIERAFAEGDTDSIVGELLPSARWSLSNAVDGILGTLCTSPNAQLRELAVEACGFRLRKRGASPEPLLKALKHKNPITQFLAAEGLARGGRAEGMQVLLSGLEYLEDMSHRERAVTALGELGDPRSVDKLLTHANNDESPLQQAAIEALGHLKKSPQADAIFRLLEKHAKGQGDHASRALIGLRWFDSPKGWDIVRAKVNIKGYGYYVNQLKSLAYEQLGYNDDPATRDLLVKAVRTIGDSEVATPAYRSLCRLSGPDSLEPNYALIQNPNAPSLMHIRSHDDAGELEPILKHGDALRVMEVFPNCKPKIQEKLEASLLTRPNLPVKEAVASLAHADEGTVRLATRLLGRVGEPEASVKRAIADTLTKWWATWQERRAKVTSLPTQDEDDDYYDDDDDDYYDDDDSGSSQTAYVAPEDALTKAGEVVESLLFTAGRVGVSADALAAVAKSRPDDPLARSIRLEAVRCLALGKVTSGVLETLESLATGPDADVRILSVELLARFDAKRASKLAEAALSDRPGFNRLAVANAVHAKDVTSAAANVHYQPVALPLFVAAKDVKTLAEVAKDRKAAEAARYGAVEGLGVMATEQAEGILAEIGKNKDDEKDLRKAAWRALRRSKRARARGAPNTLATLPKAVKTAKAKATNTTDEDEGDDE